MQTRHFAFGLSNQLAIQLTALFLMTAYAEVCVADVDMSGAWYFGVAPGTVVGVAVTQTGTELEIDVQSPAAYVPVSGTINPMTGAFTITVGFESASFCGAIYSGQLTGDTFVAPGSVAFTDPDCHSIFCACGASAPSELRGSRAPCGDGTVNGGETCDDGRLGFSGSCCALECIPGTAGETCTPDGNACTDDICDASATCTYVAVADGTSCDDGRFCNGQETHCQTGACTTGSAPCPLACDEGTDQCVTACPYPAQSCRTAEKSLFSLKLNADPSKSRLVWKWLKGSATSQVEFSDPTTTTEYALCIYNGFLPPQETIMPAGGAWQANGSAAYEYADPSGVARGIERTRLGGSTVDRAKILARGYGAQLPLLSLPTSSPITVQLYNGRTGTCWGADYTVAQMIRNETSHLKAMTP